jgi:DHH family
MNSILIDYCKRFEQTNKPDFNYVRPVFDEFFTNLKVSSHWEKLPYLHNIQNFCLRLFLAQLRGDKICIYSDYDTDAVTATATMYHGLIDLGFDPNNVEFYAPDRFTEGYGMNTEAIDMLSKKFDLIISVDCGINSWQEAEIVNQNNAKNNPLVKEGQSVRFGEIQKEEVHQCDLIITDHHHLTDKIPDCIAVINCRMSEVYNERPAELKEINQALVNKIIAIVKATPKLPQNDKYEEKQIPLVKEKVQQGFLATYCPRGGTAGDGVLKSDATPTNQLIKLKNLQTWLTKTQIQPNEYISNPNKFLSQSVTGVGVAWFSLVWYAYFLEYLENIDPIS